MHHFESLLFKPSAEHPYLGGTLVGDFEKSIAYESPRNKEILRAVYSVNGSSQTYRELSSAFGLAPSNVGHFVSRHRERSRDAKRPAFGRLATLLDRYIVRSSVLLTLQEVSGNRYFAGAHHLRAFLLECFACLPAQLQFTLVRNGRDDFIVPCSQEEWARLVDDATPKNQPAGARASGRPSLSDLYDLVSQMPDMEIAVPLLQRVAAGR